METKISQAEEIFCRYKLRATGGFMTSLIDTIFKADENNREKIAAGFPELVDVINRYGKESGYWEDLVNRWNEENKHSKLYY